MLFYLRLITVPEQKAEFDMFVTVVWRERYSEVSNSRESSHKQCVAVAI